MTGGRNFNDAPRRQLIVLGSLVGLVKITCSGLILICVCVCVLFFMLCLFVYIYCQCERMELGVVHGAWMKSGTTL